MIGDRWGVSDLEVARPYPCDSFVASPSLRAWRGVRVEAPPEAVWPWVAQVRLAPYSYDWIDNLGKRSPRRLAGLPEPVVGEPFTTALGGRRGRIVAVEPGEHLTATIMGAFLSYVLVAEPGGRDPAASQGRHADVAPAGARPVGRRPRDGAPAVAEPQAAGGELLGNS